MERIPIWKKIKEAIEYYNRKVKYQEIKDYIIQKWPETKSDTVTYQIIAITVNHPSRIHYPENKKPRITNGKSNYDQLFYTGRGEVEKYAVNKHGLWEIYYRNGSLDIRPIKKETRSFLFTWNPKLWPWDNLQSKYDEVASIGIAIEPWSCGVTKTISPGDRFFLMKIGEKPKGIFASGYVRTEPYLTKHWREDKMHLVVDLEFDVMLHPYEMPILSLEKLLDSGLTEQEWIPRASGISIIKEYEPLVEEIWFGSIRANETLNSEILYYEGGRTQIVQNAIERNPYARDKCLKHHGYSCVICKFNFAERYGLLGQGFIHVHHVIDISLSGGMHIVDPIKDLIPVCPNCHAMLHKRRPSYSVEEIKKMLS